MKGEPVIVKQLLQKAKDSALLAVEFYNKPAVSFKSEGFITMMCIAWTSLFHAYFFKNKIKPFYKENGKRYRYKKIPIELPNGETIKDNKWWELSECLKQYYGSDTNNPVRKNLEFFSIIRNMIVHRNIPELDPTLYAECQANILNFNNFLKEHFGEKHSLDYMLSYTIQMFKSNKNFLEATTSELKKKNALEIVEFINSFRSSLSTDVFESPEYSYKAVLIQVKNHESKDALPLEFINDKNLTDKDREHLKNMGIVLIKEKTVITDDVPSEFCLDFKLLISELKKEIPNFKVNNQFYQYRNEILKDHPELVHNRKLDKTNPKSLSKNYYKRELIKMIKDKYNKIALV